MNRTARKHTYITAGFITLAVVFMTLGLYSYTSPGQFDRATVPNAASQHSTGFATSFIGLAPAALDQRMADIEATGATWVRADLSWNAVQEAGPETYRWQEYDRVARSASTHHLHVLFILGLTPPWARLANCSNSELCPPSSPDAYAKFAGAAATRYTPMGVSSWEIWNEPNISYRYHLGANPALYALMLRKAYVSIIAINPSADIIAANTAPSGTDATNLTPSDFLQAMYDNGAEGYFTAISAHPYTYPKTPLTSGPLDAWGQLDKMHRIMSAHGDGGKQIWLTEFGAPTQGGPRDTRTDFVSEKLQAQILSEASAEWMKKDWAGPFFWYNFKDSGASGASAESYFGVVRTNGTRKPAYDAFVRASEAVNQQP